MKLFGGKKEDKKDEKEKTSSTATTTSSIATSSADASKPQTAKEEFDSWQKAFKKTSIGEDLVVKLSV